MSRDQLDKIANNLIEFGKTIGPAELFPVVEPNTYGLVVIDPYAFCINLYNQLDCLSSAIFLAKTQFYTYFVSLLFSLMILEKTDPRIQFRESLIPVPPIA